MPALPTPEALTRTDRPITTLVELCLYRAVSEHCGGRILPFGVRQIIKDYAFMKFNKKTLRAAVRLWCDDRAVAIQRYGDINDWDVSQVTDMSYLFRLSNFDDRIDRWDVRNVTLMSGMFYNATVFNQPLDAWDVRRVTAMDSMFCGASSFNQSLSSWDVSRVTNMQFMFSRAFAFNQPLAGRNGSQVTASSFHQPWSTREDSHGTDMMALEYCMYFVNRPLDTWDVSQVTDMSYMFNDATSFNQPLAAWDVSKVVDMTCMFRAASSFNQPLEDMWQVSQVTDMSDMFIGATSFNQPLDTRGRLNYRPRMLEGATSRPFLRLGSVSPAVFQRARVPGWSERCFSPIDGEEDCLLIRTTTTIDYR